jgi:uncharacterized protein YggE
MYVRTLVSISAVALWAVSPARLSAQDGGSVPEIITSGTGTVTLPPDRAELRINVMSSAGTASNATALNAPLAARVKAALREFGLAEEAIRPVGFTLSPIRGRSNPEQATGYEATTVFEVQVGDLKALGRVLDAAIGAGATQVPSITFLSDSVPSARKTALTRAVAAAREDAVTLTEASGGRLGGLLLVTTSPQSYDLYGQGSRLGSVMAYQPGVFDGIDAIIQDVVVTVTVQTRWRLLP